MPARDLPSTTQRAEFQFPDGFLWGSATSAHQVEGNNIHSDWWAWERTGKVKESSELACDHYQCFADDFDLAASLAHNAHRFSIEWSRIEPAEGQWDDAALTHYIEVVRALRQRHLEPIVTLHHFTSPQWLTAQGGWANPKVVDAFARYVRRVSDALGSRVRYWITINEPMVFVRMHYVQGIGPPGSTDLKGAFKVIEHLIRAHAAAYRILHGARGANNVAPRVSIAHHLPVFRPCRRWSPMDRGMAWLTDRLFNRAFLEALTTGVWHVPTLMRWTIPEAGATLDYIGVNFYGRQFIRWAPAPWTWPGRACDLDHHAHEVRERSLMGWDVHPPSFAQTLLRLAPLRLPILVTENGTWMAEDAQRWSYLVRHVQAMATALQAGARIIGYCYWSLLDNFEWADGYAPRFGLIEMDYATQQRRVRESAGRYAKICRTNRVALSP